MRGSCPIRRCGIFAFVEQLYERRARDVDHFSDLRGEKLCLDTADRDGVATRQLARKAIANSHSMSYRYTRKREAMLRVYKLKAFARFPRRELIADTALGAAVRNYDDEA